MLCEFNSKAIDESCNRGQLSWSMVRRWVELWSRMCTID